MQAYAIVFAKKSFHLAFWWHICCQFLPISFSPLGACLRPDPLTPVYRKSDSFTRAERDNHVSYPPLYIYNVYISRDFRKYPSKCSILQQPTGSLRVGRSIPSSLCTLYLVPLYINLHPVPGGRRDHNTNHGHRSEFFPKC